MHADNMHADPAFEYSMIDENVIIGTNACCQAHFDEHLLKRGVTADISLEGEMTDKPLGIMTYVWLPTPDHAAPSKENVRVGIAALKQMIANRQKVYIHCKNGHGRAPTFYAAYLIKERGMTPEEAVKIVIEKRRGAHLEESQIAFLKDFASENGFSRRA